MATDNLDSSSATPIPSATHPQGDERGRRFAVNIEAYVQMSFEEEVELTGTIGSDFFVGRSTSKRGGLRVNGSIGNESVELDVGLRRFRPVKVSGYVLGEDVSGTLRTSRGSVTFDGIAGQEPLCYELDARGTCSNFETNLGIKVIYQSFYSEILGSVDRVPDAVMVALLLPVALHKRDQV